MKRRDVLGVVAGGSVGTMFGYYLGAKELLGIQSTRTVVRETDGTGTATPTDTPPTDGSTPADDATPTEESASRTASGLPTPPYTETFDDGLDGWTVNRRFRTGEDRAPENPPAGDGGYSEQYGGSARLHVDGGPSTVGVAHDFAGLDAGTTVAVDFRVDASAPQPGLVGIALFEPDGDDMTDTDGYFLTAYGSGGNNRIASGQHHIEAPLPRDYPDGTELRVVADVWPGEFAAYVTRIQVGDSSGTDATTRTPTDGGGQAYTVDSRPEEVMEAVLRASAAGDEETVRRLTVDGYSLQGVGEVDSVTIHRLEELTVQAYAERENVSPEDVADALQQAIDRGDYGDATIVSYRSTTDRYGTVERDFILVTADGNWRVYDFGRLP